MRVTDWWISYIETIYHVHGTPFQIIDNVSGIQGLFMRLGLALLQKYLTHVSMSNVCAGWLCLIRVYVT